MPCVSVCRGFQKPHRFEQAAGVILDINLNDGSGIELRHRLKAAAVSVPVTALPETRTLPFVRLRWPQGALRF